MYIEKLGISQVTSMKKRLTIVVPAYNAEKTIKRCLDSILNQTYSNLEVLLINDGSKDSTEDICLKIAEDDNRLKVITIPNGGVSHARNVGIEKATGELITFVDSDDYIDKEMYQTLVEIMEEYNVSIVHCSYKNVDENEHILSVVGDNGKVIVQNHDEAMSCLIQGRLFIGGLCNKLYEKSLFDNIRLDETIKFNEDVLANIYLFDLVDKSVYIDKPFYNYVAVESSSTHSANAVKAGEQYLYVSNLILEISKNKPYEKDAYTRIANNLMNLYRAYIFSSDKNYKNEKKQTMKEIKEYKTRGFYNNKRDKILYLLYRYVPHLFKLAFSFYDKKRVKKLDPEQ